MGGRWSGRPSPRGLWSVCLSFPRRPDWDVVVARGLAAGLWFSLPTVNPMYMPFDNVWALAVLGEEKNGPARRVNLTKISQLKVFLNFL